MSAELRAHVAGISVRDDRTMQLLGVAQWFGW